MSDLVDWYSPSQWEPQASWLHDHEDAVDESQAVKPVETVRVDENVSQASPASLASLASLASPAPVAQRLRTRQQRRSPQDRLPLLQSADWDANRVYDRDAPICVHYDLEWKLTASGKQIAKDSEPNIVLGPSSFWQRTLRSRLDRLVGKKMGDASSVRADETSITVSVNDRSERDVTNRFDELHIDWTVVETQLVEWSDLFRQGKRLRVDITFHYVGSHKEAGPSLASTSKPRGRNSATQRMLATRNAQVQAEEVSQGCPPAWVETYEKMRCPMSCPLGPHCLRDSSTGQHYKLSTHHLRKLVKFVQEGGQLLSHDDVPESIRQDLYAEADAAKSRKRKARAISPSAVAPITINNHFPEPVSTGRPGSDPTDLSGSSSMKGLSGSPESPLIVSGYLDSAVRRYTEWQRSRFEDIDLRDEMSKACDVVLAHGLTLAQVYQDQDFQFLIDNDVKRGIARHFVSDIKMWNKLSFADQNLHASLEEIL